MRVLYFNGNVYCHDKILNNGSFIVEEGKFAWIGSKDKAPRADKVIDLNGAAVVPGFIDVHTHGFGGISVMDAAKDPNKLIQLCKMFARNGVTSFLPTTLTASLEELKEVFGAIRDLAEAETGGARIVGVNAEGPYISTHKAGAQNPEFIRSINKDEIQNLLSDFENIKIITIAPELEGAVDLIKEISDKTIVSIGHTDTGYDDACRAIEAGARNMTHLFNAMSPMSHRDPGAVGAGLFSDVYVELICDGHHVHQDVLNFVCNVKNKEKILLITDSVNPAGCEPGEYDFAGLPVVVNEEAIVLKNGGNLAGSALTMDRALRNIIRFSGMPLEEALNFITANPARLLGIDHRTGTLSVDMDADFVLLDESYNVIATYVGGNCVYSAIGDDT
ncbi:MAG: N-acetylglucosamine-6-phosphate deacetylase [Bacillota bacterium]|nr:N-acetylglucosamine-6-phosphate deacetylase [Bacillota bacterium]